MLEGDAEAHILKRVGGTSYQLNAVQAPRGYQNHPAGPDPSPCRTLGVGLGTGMIICLPVVDPFPHISVHIIKSPRVGGTADIHGLLGIISIISTAIPVIIGK